MKHTATISILLSFFAMVFFSSCDKVDPPYTKKVIVDTSSVKAVLCEEGTSTSCVNCPKGICTIERMIGTYSNNFIPIAYHFDLISNDPMYNSAWDEYNTLYANNNGLPCVVIDRKTQISYPADYNSVFAKFSTEITAIPYANMSIVNISWNSSSRMLSYTVQAKVTTEFEGEYRFNSVLTEDSVHGHGATWYQDNSFAGQGPSAMCDFGILPDPIPDSLMYYNHVARYISDGWMGAAGSISEDNDVGAVLTKQYSVTLSTSWNAANINIIGMIINQSDSTILNACQAVHVGK